MLSWSPPGVEPLLELVEDNQHLRAACNAFPAPQRRQCLFEIEIASQRRTAFAKSVEQT